MNCSRVSNQLSAYIDRELTGVEMLQVRRHLDDCEGCREEYDALCGIKMLLGRSRPAEPRADFVAATFRRLEQPPDVARRHAGQTPGARRQTPALAWFMRFQGSVIRWRVAPGVWRLASGFAAVLVAGLILSNVFIHRSRPSDALIATSPIAVLTGEDPLSDPLGAEWHNREAPKLPSFEPRLYGHQMPFNYVPVSYDGWPTIR